jgi:hypothetical protein
LVFSPIIFPVQRPERLASAARKLRIAQEEKPPMPYPHQNKRQLLLSTIMSAPNAGTARTFLVREGGFA